MILTTMLLFWAIAATVAFIFAASLTCYFAKQAQDFETTQRDWEEHYHSQKRAYEREHDKCNQSRQVSAEYRREHVSDLDNLRELLDQMVNRLTTDI
jgi:hypothetical protein